MRIREENNLRHKLYVQIHLRVVDEISNKVYNQIQDRLHFPIYTQVAFQARNIILDQVDKQSTNQI
jgi:hypothetical protein